MLLVIKETSSWLLNSKFILFPYNKKTITVNSKKKNKFDFKNFNISFIKLKYTKSQSDLRDLKI